MAVQYAALANPFCVTSIANIKCARFGFFPFIGIAVDLLNERNASLYLYCIPCQHAESIFYTHLHTIDYHLIFYFASKLYIALRAYFLNIWQQRFESGHGSQFYYIFVYFVARQCYMDLRGLLDYLGRNHWIWYSLYHILAHLFYYRVMIPNVG